MELFHVVGDSEAPVDGVETADAAAAGGAEREGDVPGGEPETASESDASATPEPDASATPEPLAAGRAFLGRAERDLVAAGVDGDRITRTMVGDRNPIEAVVEHAGVNDVIVVGETRPSVLDRVFGEATERIAAESLSPVFVVRAARPGARRSDEGE